ncbi:hypothetical protein U9M48_037365 [Paspalum notatum var. saurae]|uniref:Uncharacterized protein n=1 Tax=Paspalum notatum var. saurae TaxID=547442 RepID=A0AAQ3UJ10_PASNO
MSTPEVPAAPTAAPGAEPVAVLSADLSPLPMPGNNIRARQVKLKVIGEGLDLDDQATAARPRGNQAPCSRQPSARRRWRARAAPGCSAMGSPAGATAALLATAALPRWARRRPGCGGRSGACDGGQAPCSRRLAERRRPCLARAAAVARRPSACFFLLF